jgi:uncharacterized membrane protein YgdD (TMEM256/DUF423 family)
MMGKSEKKEGGNMMKVFVLLGGLNAFLAVALGAFGAHALKDRLNASGYLPTFETAVQYHLIHALGLILIGVLADRLGGSALMGWSGWLMFAGMILFSGSLYVLSLSGMKILGAITPLGGLAFLAGWLLVAIAVLKL